MSKYTRKADLARHAGQAQFDRSRDYCWGCGYFFTTQGRHRDDCTKPAPFVITMTVDQVLEGMS